MPKLCDGDNGKKNTSATCIDHSTLCLVRLKTYAYNITSQQKSVNCSNSLDMIF